jgi:hypothetical protein
LWIGSFVELTCANPAVVLELDPLAAGPLVGEDDPQPGGEEGGLAQALNKRLGREVHLFEHLRVGKEADDRAAFLGDPDLLQVGKRLAARELLAVHLPVAMHFRHQPLGKGVDHGHAHTMQAAGDLVALSTELSARVQLCQDDGKRRLSLVLHDLDGDAAAGVPDGD